MTPMRFAVPNALKDWMAEGERRASPPMSEGLAELRRQQAEFQGVVRDIGRDNRWMAGPALAPFLGIIGAEVATLSALRSGAASNLVNREAWRAASRVPPKLSKKTRTALREVGRERYEQAYGRPANSMRSQDHPTEVHHNEPLEWAHLSPLADPNRLANLSALPRPAHIIASREWDAFRRSLGNRIPTPAERMAAKLRIDRMVEPYLQRPGVARPRVPPKIDN